MVFPGNTLILPLFLVKGGIAGGLCFAQADHKGFGAAFFKKLKCSL